MFIKSVDNGNSPFQSSNWAKFAKSVLTFAIAGVALVGTGIGLVLTGVAATSPVLALVGVGSLLAGKASFAGVPLSLAVLGYRLIRDSNKLADKDLDNGEFVLKGSWNDVRKVKKLDKKIIGLSRKFNKVSQLPENVAAKIRKLVEKNADAASRVSLTYVSLGNEEPVRNLEYRNEYPNLGSTSRQTVARVKLAG